MDPDDVPGILLTSRPLQAPAPGARSRWPRSILAEFGVTDFPDREETQ